MFGYARVIGVLVFLVTGVTGAGKSTLARRLRQWGHYTISLDAEAGLCRWTDASGRVVVRPAHPDQGWLAAHRWTWDADRLDEVIARAAGRPVEVVWLFGYAANAVELADRFDAVFLLDIDLDTMRQRLTRRAGNDFGRAGDTLTMAEVYYREFLVPWRRRGAVTIDATQDVETVAQDLLMAGAQAALDLPFGTD